MLYDAYLFLTLCGLVLQLKEFSGLSSLKCFLPAYNGLIQGYKGLWLCIAYTHLSNPIGNLNEGKGSLQLGTTSEGRGLLIIISAMNCWVEIHNTIYLVFPSCKYYIIKQEELATL